jgi:hypothetical protein
VADVGSPMRTTLAGAFRRWHPVSKNKSRVAGKARQTVM